MGQVRVLFFSATCCIHLLALATANFLSRLAGAAVFFASVPAGFFSALYENATAQERVTLDKIHCIVVRSTAASRRKVNQLL